MGQKSCFMVLERFWRLMGSPWSSEMEMCGLILTSWLPKKRRTSSILLKKGSSLHCGSRSALILPRKEVPLATSSRQQSNISSMVRSLRYSLHSCIHLSQSLPLWMLSEMLKTATSYSAFSLFCLRQGKYSVSSLEWDWLARTGMNSEQMPCPLLSKLKLRCSTNFLLSKLYHNLGLWMLFGRSGCLAMKARHFWISECLNSSCHQSTGSDQGSSLRQNSSIIITIRLTIANYNCRILITTSTACAGLLLLWSAAKRKIIILIMIVNRPVTLYFQPLGLEAKFEKCLKLQIAIFRLSSEEAKGGKRAVKMDKTEPVKFTNPAQKITFAKTLSLLTTLPFNTQTLAYESKEVDFEMALEIDGRKERMGRKINLKDLLTAKHKNYKFAQESPAIVLNYRAEVKLQDERTQSSPKKIQQPKKSPKVLRFEEEEENAKENLRAAKPEAQQVRPQRLDKGRHKTVFFQPNQPEVKITDNRSEESERVLKKYKSLNKNASSTEQQSKEERTAGFELEIRMKEQRERHAKLESLYNKAERNAQELEKKLKEKDEKIAELIHKNQQLQQRIQSQLKTLKRQKEELKRQHTAKTGQQSQMISQLREQIRTYQSQVQKYRKSALTLQQSSKHIATGNEQEVKTLKDKIYSLQKLTLQSSKESEFYQQSLRNKDEIISDLKARIYSLDKENTELQNKVKSLQTRLVKSKEEYQFQLQQLQSKIQEMREDNKNFKIATLKDIKDDSSTDYRKRAEQLEKQLEKKEELLRKMTEMKKEGEQERSHEVTALRKELAELKELNDRLESSKGRQGGECGDIEMKIQLQRLKKEVESARKNQKALLIEKGKLQASNRSLQDDIVKSKCAIANILNAVQETANQKLITEVYSLTE